MFAVFACGSDDPGADSDCLPRTSGIEPEHAHLDGMGTYAGASCLESGCHLSGAVGADSPAYLAAGTIFKADGVTPQAGATMRLVPLNNGAPAVAVTDASGNFFILAGTTNPFPAIPEVTACPNVDRMLEGAFDPSYGNCNVEGCHSLQPGPGPGPIVLND